VLRHLYNARGYGGSSGAPTQSDLLQDGEAAYREAHARGYDGDRIVLMGASLGTGVAIALGMTHEVAALVLEALFSALDIASAR
jgi:pimeloyl-ACP methyl ester carboxylesterase